MLPPAQDEHKAYPLQNYFMVERERQEEEDNSVPARIERLESQYKESGARRSVEGLMVVTHQGFPHVLVLQVANAFYKLPGGYLDPSESYEDGLLSRLNEQMGIPPSDTYCDLLSPPGGSDWKVGDCVSTWWRPNFDVIFYPYLPPHHTVPKEVKKLFMVHLPYEKTFAVPSNMKLHAIPVYELYDNAARYGAVFAGIPHILSRYRFPQHNKAVGVAVSEASARL